MILNNPIYLPKAMAMEALPMLRCFQHCDRKTNILCLDVPPFCPLCHQNTMATESRIPPYQLPTPFVMATSCWNCIVLRPTDGDFICDYMKTCNLHIGITDSQGTVYDFDEDGLHIGSPWQQCICIEVLPNKEIESREWDRILLQFAQPQYWNKNRYKAVRKNCFDFVLGFLQTLPPLNNLPALQNKRSFCNEFLVKKTNKAVQYISLYRQVLSHGFVCQKS